MYSQTPKISSYIMTIKFMETTSNTSSLAKCLIDSPDEKKINWTLEDASNIAAKHK